MTLGRQERDLSPARRARDLEAGPTDVLVIGGGITGAGIALDAATRGLSVTLLEADDLGFGTSRWSSKLVHGGLRYLASGDVGVAWESAVERGHLMTTIAPFLVRSAAQVVPIMDDTSLGSAVLTRAGFAAGDALRIGSRTSRGTLPGPRLIGRAKTTRLLPALDAARVRGGILGWDGQLEDDARLVIAVARTAAAYGAHIITGMRVVSADGSSAIAESAAGDRMDFSARHVINATGVWAAGLDPQIAIRPSRGTHVLLRAETLGRPRAAMTVPVPEMRGRYCFAIPRPDGLVLAGITDIDQPGSLPAVPEPPASDVEWILEQISRCLRVPVGPADAVGAFAGLRPLVDEGGGSSTADVSRRHLVRRGDNGMITVTGGKLTTYRRMAQDAVDLVTDAPCITASLPLIGNGPIPDGSRIPARLVRRYGSEAGRVAALADDAPWLLDPLAPTVGVRGVELVFGALCEGARTRADLVERRVRLSLVPADLEAASDGIDRVLAYLDANSWP